MLRKLIVLGVVVVAGLAAYAQDDAPKAEVAVMYSYARYVPSFPNTNNYSLNGAGASLDYNFMKYVGIKAELIDYASTTNTVNAPQGPVQVSGNLFTYLFGPQIGKRSGTFRPYGHALFGGAHSSLYTNAAVICGVSCVSNNPSSNTFAMAFGGGLDIAIHKNISIRPGQIDYLYTHFSNPLTNQNNQNSFRYAGGVVFTF